MRKSFEDLGRLMNADRRVGADALVLDEEANALQDGNFEGLRAIAIVFETVNLILTPSHRAGGFYPRREG